MHGISLSQLETEVAPGDRTRMVNVLAGFIWGGEGGYPILEIAKFHDSTDTQTSVKSSLQKAQAHTCTHICTQRELTTLYQLYLSTFGLTSAATESWPLTSHYHTTTCHPQSSGPSHLLSTEWLILLTKRAAVLQTN